MKKILFYIFILGQISNLVSMNYSSFLDYSNQLNLSTEISSLEFDQEFDPKTICLFVLIIAIQVRNIYLLNKNKNFFQKKLTSNTKIPGGVVVNQSAYRLFLEILNFMILRANVPSSAVCPKAEYSKSILTLFSAILSIINLLNLTYSDAIIRSKIKIKSKIQIDSQILSELSCAICLAKKIRNPIQTCDFNTHIFCHNCLTNWYSKRLKELDNFDSVIFNCPTCFKEINNNNNLEIKILHYTQPPKQKLLDQFISFKGIFIVCYLYLIYLAAIEGCPFY